VSPSIDQPTDAPTDAATGPVQLDCSSVIITVHEGYEVLAFDVRDGEPQLLLGHALQDDEHGLAHVQELVDALLEPVRAQLVAQLVRPAVPRVGQRVLLPEFDNGSDVVAPEYVEVENVDDAVAGDLDSTIIVRLVDHVSTPDDPDGVREVPLDQVARGEFVTWRTPRDVTS
jgi:hypothetical protein